MNVSSWFSSLVTQAITFEMSNHISNSIFGYISCTMKHSSTTFFINGGVYLS